MTTQTDAAPAEAPPSATAGVPRSGIGGVRVPSRFIRTSAQDEFLGKGGVWETPGFDSAEHKIAVRYEMGVGGLEVTEI